MKLLGMLGAYLGVGVAVGVISGLFGIGGGILMVPALIYIWAREPKVAVATSLAVMIPGAIAGVLRHQLSYHTVDWRVAAGLAVGAMLGSAFIGAPLANYLPGETLKKGFGVLLIIFGLQMSGVFGFLAVRMNSLFHTVAQMIG